MTTDWRTNTQPTDDGHLIWTALRHNGTPTLVAGKRRHSAPAYVYTTHHGRPPVGKVTTSCRILGCVEPTHLLDYNDRQELYQLLAAKRFKSNRQTCGNGHAWSENGAFERTGQRRCDACRAGQTADVSDLAVQFALAGTPEELTRLEELEVVRRAICITGATHEQVAPLIGRSPRTVTRWARKHGWKKPALL